MHKASLSTATAFGAGFGQIIHKIFKIVCIEQIIFSLTAAVSGYLPPLSDRLIFPQIFSLVVTNIATIY